MSENLMLRLQAFQFDPRGVALPFAARLARENGWSSEYTARVIAEYKRFVYLAMRAGHPVTPSKAVDEVWHLHLCYTRSYWDELCGKVLEKPLHHGPTEGGAAEDSKFQDWYANTLRSYAAHFHEIPPADIWPTGEQKSHPDAHWRIPKRPVKRALSASLIGACPFLLVGCTDDPAINASLFFFGLLFLGILLVTNSVSRARRHNGRHRSKKSHRGSGCGAAGFTSCGSSDSHHSSSHNSSDSGGGSSCGGSSCGGGGCGGGDD